MVCGKGVSWIKAGVTGRDGRRHDPLEEQGLAEMSEQDGVSVATSA